MAYFQQQLNLVDDCPKICVPEVEMTQMHISGRDHEAILKHKPFSTFCVFTGKLLTRVMYFIALPKNSLIMVLDVNIALFTKFPPVDLHLSTALPPEVLMYVFRWVVSSDLDIRALEQLSLVCRGFYIRARSDRGWYRAMHTIPCRNTRNSTLFGRMVSECRHLKSGIKM